MPCSRAMRACMVWSQSLGGGRGQATISLSACLASGWSDWVKPAGRTERLYLTNRCHSEACRAGGKQHLRDQCHCQGCAGDGRPDPLRLSCITAIKSRLEETCGTRGPDPIWSGILGGVARVVREGYMGSGSRLRRFRCTQPADSCLPASGVDKQGELATRAEGVGTLKVSAVDLSSARDSSAGLWRRVCNNVVSCRV